MSDNKKYGYFQIKKFELNKKSNSLKSKSFTSNHFFKKKRSESYKTNKIESHLFKIKQSPFNGEKLNKKEIFKKRLKLLKNPENVISYNNLTVNDSTLLEMNEVKRKAKIIEKNIKLLTREYNDLENKNKGNSIIIEKILDLYGDEVLDKINEKEINDIDNKEKNLSDIKEQINESEKNKIIMNKAKK